MYEKSIITTIQSLSEDILKNVMTLLNDFFLLFDYAEISEDTYKTITDNYIAGKLT